MGNARQSTEYLSCRGTEKLYIRNPKMEPPGNLTICHGSELVLARPNSLYLLASTQSKNDDSKIGLRLMGKQCVDDAVDWSRRPLSDSTLV